MSISDSNDDRVIEKSLLDRAQAIFQQYMQLRQEMMEQQHVRIIDGVVKVYKKPVVNHPTGIVLGVAEYPLYNSALKSDAAANTSDNNCIHNLEDFMAIFQSSGCRMIWDEMFNGADLIEAFSLDCKIALSKSKAVWPVSPRDLLVGAVSLQVPSDAGDGSTSITAGSSSSHGVNLVAVGFSLPEQQDQQPTCPIVKDEWRQLKADSRHVRACLDMGVMHLEDLKNGCMRVSYMIQTNPNGSIPSWIMDTVSSSFPISVSNIASYYHKYGFPPYVKSTGSGLKVLTMEYVHSTNVFECSFKVLLADNCWFTLRVDCVKYAPQSTIDIKVSGNPHTCQIVRTDKVGKELTVTFDDGINTGDTVKIHVSPPPVTNKSNLESSMQSTTIMVNGKEIQAQD
ncbi:hypothetical protein MIR68_008747 [Amoeboaphelidium protococcarum]|nr:hypothetical protein MIR68_008747 [Amoeboaphelidium protococcarum]